MLNNAQMNWQKTLRLGLIGGLVGILIALVGMVESFDKRDIIAGVITMGQTLLLLAVLVTAYFAATNSARATSPLSILSGVIAGLIFSLMLGLLALAIENFDLRPVLVNASPQLVRILTFEEGLPGGLVNLFLMGVVIGAVGGVIHMLPARIRSAVTLGLAVVAFIGLMQEILQVTLRSVPALDDGLTWMFGRGTEKGVSAAGAIVIFIVTVV
ncbi:MAG TPA: hypothetical protein VHO49_14585, partial [Anaerolineales bacterium]|nr:hypothetical protein [Anaerolineales bacterium]